MFFINPSSHFRSFLACHIHVIALMVIFMNDNPVSLASRRKDPNSYRTSKAFNYGPCDTGERRQILEEAAAKKAREATTIAITQKYLEAVDRKRGCVFSVRFPVNSSKTGRLSLTLR